MACITSVGVALLILSAGCVESADKTNVEVEIVDPVERVLSSGARHACAILEDGGTQCWGSNDRRQLGHDAMPVANAPLPVLGVPAFVEVAAGDSHTCGRTGAGEVFCWGGRHGLAKRLIEVSNAKQTSASAVGATIAKRFFSRNWRESTALPTSPWVKIICVRLRRPAGSIAGERTTTGKWGIEPRHFGRFQRRSARHSEPPKSLAERPTPALEVAGAEPIAGDKIRRDSWGGRVAANRPIR
jgi:hypothetical protein